MSEETQQVKRADMINAQNKATEKADLFFDTYQYVNAITEYKTLFYLEELKWLFQY